MTRRAVLLFALSVVVLAAQVALTRLFSVIFWYHFGFLILSTSLLGFAAGGVAIRLMRERTRRWDPDRAIAVAVAASGALLALALFLITHNHVSPAGVHQRAGAALKLVLASLALFPPFMVMGGTVIFMLQRWSENVDRLYAANLLGSGMGCLLAITLLDRVGGLTAYVTLAATLPAIAGWYAFRLGGAYALASAGTAILILSTLALSEAAYPLESPRDKAITCRPPSVIVFRDWTSLAKVDICEERLAHTMRWGLWGISRTKEPRLPERLGVVIDYWAYTTILKHKDEPGYYDFIERLPSYVAYHWLDRPKVLTIGSGGGMDIRAALLNEASEVDAVEINPSIFRAMTEDLAEYSGNVYLQPQVRAHLAEGRRFVESSERRWDLIQVSGVDTHSATQAGAFALSENFLYTREAFASYLDHLEEDGVLTLTRWYSPSEGGLPRFSLRLFTLAIESLADHGIEDPQDHVLFIRSRGFTVVLIKKQPITASEIDVIDSVVRKMDYAYLFRPDEAPDEASRFYDFVDAPNRAEWIEDYPFNVSAPTDDSPFFFEHRKLRNIHQRERFIGLSALDGQTILVILLLEMAGVSAVLVFVSHRLDGGGRRPIGWLYFASIGLGFMLVEVSFSQRLVLFLGHPASALTVVMFTLLVFSGLGSMYSTRIERLLPGGRALFVVAALMLLWAWLGNPLLRALIAWPGPARVATAVALIAPAGLLMGTAFPGAVRRLVAGGEEQLGVYWAWNGVASVTASVLAVLVAMGSGFGTVMLIAAAFYVIAGLTLPRLR